MLAISSRKVPVLGAMLFEKGIFGKVGCVATSSQDDGTMSSFSLSTVDILDAND